VNELSAALIVSAVYVLLFGSSELLRTWFQLPVEQTRKFVHAASGMVCLSFPWLFDSALSVGILCSVFAGIMVISSKKGLLKSIHNVQRSSEGAVYYPLAVWLTFFITTTAGSALFYVISILILAVCDSASALVGKAYGKNVFVIEEDFKSLEGSGIFFVLTFLIIASLLYLFGNYSLPVASAVALYVAIIITGLEIISLKGSDNLWIPVGVAACLIKFTQNDLAEMLQQIWLLSAHLAGCILVARLSRRISFSSAVALGLLAYSAWVLVVPLWSAAVAMSLLLISFTPWFHTPQKKSYRMRYTLRLFGVTFIWVLLANFSHSVGREIFYSSFALSMCGYVVATRIYKKATSLQGTSTIEAIATAVATSLLYIPFAVAAQRIHYTVYNITALIILSAMYALVIRFTQIPLLRKARYAEQGNRYTFLQNSSLICLSFSISSAVIAHLIFPGDIDWNRLQFPFP